MDLEEKDSSNKEKSDDGKSKNAPIEHIDVQLRV